MSSTGTLSFLFSFVLALSLSLSCIVLPGSKESVSRGSKVSLDRSPNEYDDGRQSISNEDVVLYVDEFDREGLHDKDVQVESFNQHPKEVGQGKVSQEDVSVTRGLISTQCPCASSPK